MLFELYLDGSHTLNLCIAHGNGKINDLSNVLGTMAFLGQDVLIKDVFCKMWYRWNGTKITTARPHGAYAQ